LSSYADHDFFAVAFPPWLEFDWLDPEWLCLPPRLDAPGEFAIFAARLFDIPLSFNASYCLSFFTATVTTSTTRLPAPRVGMR
jgi:hypothetical protein